MPSVGQLHFAASLLALASGAWVLLRDKGSASHRRAGWVYVGSMFALNLTALMIYRLTRTVGPFHVAAVLSLATVVAGVLPAWRRLPARGWVDRHYYFMTWSYVGLAAAAVSESATRIPAVRAIAGGPTAGFWLAVALATLTVVAVGAVAIRRGASTTLPAVRPR